MDAQRVHTTGQSGARWWWPALGILAALVPVHGLFTLERVFHVRDLSLFYWPRHLWVRETLRAGELPLWDPYTAGGQSAVADLSHHLFFLPALLLRLVAPDVAGFNLWVALPLPVAAAGAYLLFRRRYPPPAAAAGAAIFALAGPVASSLLVPTLSWSVALMPWVLWAGSRVAEREHLGRAPTVVLGATIALQALAGDPVVFTATMILLGGVAWMPAAQPRPNRLAIAAGIGAGLAMSAVQLLPAAHAALGSERIAAAADAGSSLHPFSALDVLLPFFFGNPYHAPLADLPWVRSLNAGGDPLLNSTYLGAGALTLILAGSFVCRDRRWVRLWAATALAAFAAALVEMRVLTLAALGAGALAAAGAAALQQAAVAEVSRRRVLVILAAISALAVMSAAWLALQQLSASPLRSFATMIVGAGHVDPALQFLRASAPTLLVRLSILSAASAMLFAIAASAHQRRSVAAGAVAALAILDLASAHAGVNPTIAVEQVRRPEWVQAVADGSDRVYVGGRIAARYGSPGVDALPAVYLPAELPPLEARTVIEGRHSFAPSGWHLREVISYDPRMRWDATRVAALDAFSTTAAPANRLRFLARAGVRYCLVGEKFDRWAPTMVWVRGFAHSLGRPGTDDAMSLYECNPAARRVFVAETALAEPMGSKSMARLFDPAVPAEVLVLSEPPPAAAGRPGTAGAASATILEDRPERVVVRAVTGPEGGYLALLDTFSSDWQVSVDGEPAPLLRANALFRGVRLTAGEHQVEFRYRPAAFYAGALVSLIGTTVLCCPPVRRRRAAAAPAASVSPRASAGQ